MRVKPDTKVDTMLDMAAEVKLDNHIGSYMIHSLMCSYIQSQVRSISDDMVEGVVGTVIHS